MEDNKLMFPWIELVIQPTFCVKNGMVLATNEFARKYNIHEGMNVFDIITQHREEYETFQSGTLYLTITAGNQEPYRACVTRTDEYDIISIVQTDADPRLEAMSLAAKSLRNPLSNLMILADDLFKNIDLKESKTQQQIGKINQNLFRMLRIITNMSDANSYKKSKGHKKQAINLTAMFAEIMEKAQTICASSQRQLEYTAPDTTIIGMAEEEKLRRAVYNLISNAIKFSPVNSVVVATLKQNKNMLSFSVTNKNAEPVSDANFQHSYARTPVLEKECFGLGLGMTLVYAIVCSHGGTVLVDHTSTDITRITITIEIVKDKGGKLRSPIANMGDYAGGHDKGLLELSDVLSSDAYNNIN